MGACALTPPPLSPPAHSRCVSAVRVHLSPTVLLHVKRSDKDGFLASLPAATEVQVALTELVRIHNLRGKVNRLAAAAEQLAMHGPMKLPEQQGLDDSTPLLEDYDVKKGEVVPHAAPTVRACPFCAERSTRSLSHTLYMYIIWLDA